MATRQAVDGSLATEQKCRAAQEVATRREQLIRLSHAVHGNPELSWKEEKAAAAVAESLRDAGFSVETEAYGLPTALEATYGDGDLTVAICAEYDALPGVGHACGHNVIAAAGVGAALALARVAAEAGIRIKLLGTPAEEHGGGKVVMLKEGAWEDVDFSLMVHGTTGDDRSAASFRSTAVDRFRVTYTGKTAHAAAAPEQGINAAAASTLSLTALALLRQQLPKDTNCNAFISHGGEATNIIPDRTEVQVEIRAYDIEVWRDLKRRVLACFQGAATATGCNWSWNATEHAYAPLNPDPVLARAWDRNVMALGRTISSASAATGGSTDMGNVSQVVPSIHPLIAFIGETGVEHTLEFAAAAASRAADDAVVDAATSMAWTVLDIALDESLRTEFLRRTAGRQKGATRVTLEA